MNPANTDHPFVIEPAARRVRIYAMGRQIADTMSALTLTEWGQPPVLYLPRADVDMALLKRDTRTTVSPDKGIATYYSIEVGGDSFADAGWSYEDPIPGAEQIRGFISFNPQLVYAPVPSATAVDRIRNASEHP